MTQIPESKTPEQESLLPCPFCGGTPIFRQGVYTSYVHCKACDVMGPNLDRSDAIAAWNKRPYDPRLVELVEKMRDQLQVVQKLITEAAMTGFNWQDGDWPQRLFESQQQTSAVLRLSREA